MQQQQSEQTSQEMETLMESIKKALEREIEQGAIEVENLGQQIVIRMREKGAFPEGSAFLQPKFRPLVRQIAELVKDVPGIVSECLDIRTTNRWILSCIVLTGTCLRNELYRLPKRWRK